MAHSAKRNLRPWDANAFPGFHPLPTVRGVFGDPKARDTDVHAGSPLKTSPTRFPEELK